MTGGRDGDEHDCVLIIAPTVVPDGGWTHVVPVTVQHLRVTVAVPVFQYAAPCPLDTASAVAVLP